MITDVDKRFLQLCHEERRLSHDPSRQVAALIVDRGGKVISAGTNRAPASTGLTASQSFAEIQANPEWKYFMLEHAERDAITNAKNRFKDLCGSTIYTTLFPCADCARAIVEANISRVVAPDPSAYSEQNEKWKVHFDFAMRIFNLSGVELDFYEKET